MYSSKGYRNVERLRILTPLAYSFYLFIPMASHQAVCVTMNEPRLRITLRGAYMIHYFYTTLHTLILTCISLSRNAIASCGANVIIMA